MKHSYQSMPELWKDTYADFSKMYGFSWMEFLATVPSPLILVTTYKANGLTNATMQSWATFTSANHGNGFYAILASVNKNGHLYAALQDRRQAVINFPSVACFDACMRTIQNNQLDADEISASGLTACRAEWVDAPMVQECFMNLECQYLWEKEIIPGDDHVMICLEVIGVHVDDTHLNERTGDQGILYNIHHAQNPESEEKTAHDFAAVLQKKIDILAY